ncbi:hypothetical protein GCM10010232_58790 [Streptomyces amakusaensis]
MRAVGGALACGLLMTGCSGADAAGSPRAAPSATDASTSAGAGAGTSAVTGSGSGTGVRPRPSGPAFTPDPAKVPRTAEAARELARAVVAGPELWGPGFVAGTPALSAPGHWPVLDERCVWQGGTVPAGVLHSVTASSERPAAGAGRSPLRVAATVTVHRDVRRAEWEMAETLEEALRCPGQKLREGERVEGLMSIGYAFGSKYNLTADDSIGEIGRYRGTESGDRPYEYGWFQYRLGTVTVAAVTKGADGHTKDEINRARVDALVGMARRIETRLGTAG